MKDKNKTQFIRYKNIDKAKITSFKPSDDVKKVLGIGKYNKEKSVHDYFREDLGIKEHKIFIEQFNNYIHSTIPKTVKETCKVCDLSGEQYDTERICNAYYSEGHGNLFFALYTFYSILYSNKHLFKEAKQRKSLCYAFISCFQFHKGRVYFDVKKLGLQCLKEGLLSISQILTSNKPFKRMEIINESLHKLDNEQRFYSIDNGEKNELIEYQIEHFKEAKRFYDEDAMNKLINSNSKIKDKPSIKDNRQIIFRNEETLTKVYELLKENFIGKESEFKEILEGKDLKEKLLFPHSQNKFVELFRRLKYNDFIISKSAKIERWICENFCFQFTKGTINEIRNFNKHSVHDIMTKDKGSPTKKERICKVDWLPFKTANQLKHLKQQEKK